MSAAPQLEPAENLPPDRPSGIEVRPTVTPATLAAVDAAVHSVKRSHRVTDDVCDDLRQELLIKVANGTLTIFGLRVAARNWIVTLTRNRVRARATEHEYEAGTARRYKTGDAWSPDWYAPHPDAKQFAPFAMRDARVMHCKVPPRSFCDVEEAMAEYLDSRSAR